MPQDNYFPQGIATDDAFCNRETERAFLRNSIKTHENIVLVAPRRYGKTSLITQVLKENNFPGERVDFFFALRQEDVRKSIAEAVSKIISSLLPKTKTAGGKLINTIIANNPKITFNFLGSKLEIDTKQIASKSIAELLLVLDQFAVKTDKSCTLIFDEFQQIGELKENHAVEAAIRHAVERSQKVSYIFCGSSRHLLSQMFSNKNRPLYHLCDLMTIERIDVACYHKFMNKLAKRKWGVTLDADVLNEMTDLTQCHPYYVNALCRFLWRFDEPPNSSKVTNTWDEYINQQKNWITADIGHLTLNRRKVITALAYEATKEPQGAYFSERTGLTPSCTKKSLTDLIKLDMIYCDNKGYYRIIDPAIAYFLCQYA